jgi:hypothetical protein
MDSKSFISWLKGFTEACPEFHPTPKQWDRLKEVLNEVEDHEEDNGLVWEIDDFEPENPEPSPQSQYPFDPQLYRNPKGFGYYTNSTLDKTTPEETKKQLLD